MHKKKPENRQDGRCTKKSRKIDRMDLSDYISNVKHARKNSVPVHVQVGHPERRCKQDDEIKKKLQQLLPLPFQLCVVLNGCIVFCLRMSRVRTAR